MKNIPQKILLKYGPGLFVAVEGWSPGIFKLSKKYYSHDIADVSQVLYKYLSALNHENKLSFFFPSMDILLP